MKSTNYLKNPSNRNRLKPFWFWNGKITKTEINRQLLEMKKEGLGGAFICARQGLKTPYLSHEWFELIEYTCIQAQSLNMEIWLYDEYPYPSGMAGGEVLNDNPDAIHTKLSMKSFILEGETRQELNLGWSKILYAKAIKLDSKGKCLWESKIDIRDDIGIIQTQEILQESGMTAYNTKRYFSYGPEHILSFILPKGNWKVIVIGQEVIDDYKYYGNYFDPCNKDAVSSFIRMTHEKYYNYFGDKFCKYIKGIFSDEVFYLDKLPWSPCLPKYMEEKYGYSIIDVLPALFDNTYPMYAMIRYQYFQSANELLIDSYYKQVSNWCHEHGILFLTEVPSLRRTTQILSDIPGGDPCHEKLGVSLDEVYDKYLIDFRKSPLGISSLARQNNKEFALVESFHSIGWSMTLQDAKWMIDWIAAMGINFNVLHAFFYTIDSIVKYDAPPSQFLQNPYWSYYHIFADYSARLSTMITETKSVSKIAFIDPITTIWTRLGSPRKGFEYAGYDEKENRQLKKIINDWLAIAKTLLYHQIPFDFLDAEMLNNAVIDNKSLVIGKANYDVLLMAPCASIENAATKKIEEFINQGGSVIALGLLPYEVIDSQQQIEHQFLSIFHAVDNNKIKYWECEDDTSIPMRMLLPNTRKHNKPTVAFLPWSSKVEKQQKLNELIDILDCIELNPFSIHTQQGNPKELCTSVRIDEHGDYYIFLVNHGNSCNEVIIDSYINMSKVYQIDLESGNYVHINAFTGYSKIAISLSRYESKLIKIILKKENEKLKADTLSIGYENKKEIINIVVPDRMEVSIIGENVFRINEFQITVDDNNYVISEPCTWIELCARFSQITGDRFKYQSKFGTPKHIQIDYPITIHYHTEVVLDFNISKLGMMFDKHAIKGKYSILWNGRELDKEQFSSYYVYDQNNIGIVISDTVQGINNLDLYVTIEHDSDGVVDSLYLLGDFKIENNRIVPNTKESFIHTKYIEGYPWYSGTFHMKFKWTPNIKTISKDFFLQPILNIPSVDCIRFLINGHDLGVKAFAPYQYLCSKEWLKEVNEIEIRLTNTLAPRLEGKNYEYDK